MSSITAFELVRKKYALLHQLIKLVANLQDKYSTVLGEKRKYLPAIQNTLENLYKTPGFQECNLSQKTCERWFDELERTYFNPTVYWKQTQNILEGENLPLPVITIIMKFLKGNIKLDDLPKEIPELIIKSPYIRKVTGNDIKRIDLGILEVGNQVSIPVTFTGASGQIKSSKTVLPSLNHFDRNGATINLVIDAKQVGEFQASIFIDSEWGQVIEINFVAKFEPKAFIFQNGKKAHNLKELVHLCSQYPDLGVLHLTNGDFEPWLHDSNNKETMQCAKTARLSSLPDLQKLKQFLDGSGIPHSFIPPALKLRPADVNFGLVDPGSSDPGANWAAFVISNDGGHHLQGTVTVLTPWLEILSNPHFDLKASEQQKITVRILSTCPLPKTSGQEQLFVNSLRFTSNDVTGEISCRYKALFPQLIIEPEILDFGIFDPADSARIKRKLTFRNTGDVSFRARISPKTGFTISETDLQIDAGASKSIIITMNQDCPKPAKYQTKINHSNVIRFEGANVPTTPSIFCQYSVLGPELNIIQDIVHFPNKLNLANRFSPSPKAALLIQNRGKGVGILTGQVSSSQSWLHVSPSTFSLSAGEELALSVTLNRNVPIPKRGSIANQNGILVTSNGGEKKLPVLCNINRVGFPFLLAWIILPLIFLGLFGSLIDYFLYRFDIVPYNSYDVINQPFLLFGLVLGLPQWLVLRRVVSNSWNWVLASAIYPVGLYLLNWYYSSYTNATSPGVFFDISLATFSTAFVGMMAWLALRKRVANAGWLILPYAISWISIVFAFDFIESLPLAYIAIGLVMGLVTGIPLLVILRRGLRQEDILDEIIKVKWAKNWGEIIIITAGLGLVGGVLLPCSLWLIAWAVFLLTDFFVWFGSQNIWLQFLILGAIGFLIGSVAGLKKKAAKEIIYSGLWGLGIFFTIFIFYNGTIWLNWISMARWSVLFPSIWVDSRVVVGIISAVLLVSESYRHISKSNPCKGKVVLPKILTFVLSILLGVVIALFFIYWDPQRNDFTLKYWWILGGLGALLGITFIIGEFDFSDQGDGLAVRRSTAHFLHHDLPPILWLATLIPALFALFFFTGEIVQVQANNPAWRNTSLYLHPKDVVILVQIDGTWSADKYNFNYVAGDGYKTMDANKFCADSCYDATCARNYPLASLIARQTRGTNENTKRLIYYVGFFQVIQTDKYGYLLVKINDCYPDDNDGSLMIWALNLKLPFRK